MKRFGGVAAVWTVAVLAGCASGPLGARPVVSSPSEGAEGRDDITLSFQLADEDLTAATVLVEYSYDGVTWLPATLHGASPGVAVGSTVTGLRPADAGVPITCSVAWDSWADGVAMGGSTPVTVRLTPSDVDGPGVAVVIPSFTVDNHYPVLDVDPLTVAFAEGVTGLTNPADVMLDVTNLGPAGTQMDWTTDIAPASPTWLTVAPDLGFALDSGVSAAVTLSAECASNDLTPDTYTATITVAGEDATSDVARSSPQEVQVTFTVREQRPEILIHNGDGTTPLADLPVFTCVQGQADPVATPSFWVKNSSTEPASLLSWTATDDLGSATWLVYAPASSAAGTGPLAAGDDEQVTASISGGAALPAGHYYATITVDGSGVDGHTLTDEARTVAVHLWVKVPPIMQLSSESVSFTGACEGTAQPSPSQQSVTLTNPGEVDLDWTADWVGGAPNWLSVSIDSTPVTLPTSGLAAKESADSRTITLTVDSLAPAPPPADLPAGDYSATIRLTDQYGVTQDLDVSLHVGTRATIVRSPPSLSFTAVQGGSNPADRIVSIWRTGEAPLNWTADVSYTTGSGWLELNGGAPPVSDTCTTEVDDLYVTALTGALPVGTYDATITISDPESTNLTQTVAVTFQVIPPSYFEGFESGFLGAEWWTNSTATGRIQVNSYDPYAGLYQLIMDSSIDGTYSLN
ncbi:MAG: hypothetical protein ACYSU0_20345, partial [Planctomycetota bacterium]